jgi:hypothetical protein
MNVDDILMVPTLVFGRNVLELKTNTTVHEPFKEGELEYLLFIAKEEMHIKSDVGALILLAIQDACVKHEHPTIKHAAMEYISRQNCTCLHIIPLERAISTVVHIWKQIIQPPIYSTCAYVLMVYEYFVIQGYYPNNTELRGFINTNIQFHNSPDEYFEDNRVNVPVENIGKLNTCINEVSNTACSICLDDIQSGELVYKLPQCGHVFHAHTDRCLGNGTSILTWLHKSRLCPNCNTEVTV